jgi:protein pelota
MRILRIDVKHDTVTVMPEILDDFWVLYNVIQKGDKVYAKTTREVKSTERYEKPEKSKRISVFLGISVKSIVWDRYLNRLRVHGIVCDSPDEIGALGSHHTLDITLNKPLTIVKDRWMRYQLDQIERAAEKGIPPLTILSIDDEGYCTAVLRGFGLDFRDEKNVNLPGKLDASERQRTLNELFKFASTSLERLWNEVRSPIVVIGLGFIKNQFIKYLEENKPEMREKVIDVKSVNSIGQAGIREALRSGVLSKALKHLRIVEETEAVEEFLKRLGRERARATYGLTEVVKASTLGAVENILLTDARLREGSDEERVLIENLMREVEKKGGKVTIISTEHEAGEKLHSFGGIAALLRFPLD